MWLDGQSTMGSMLWGWPMLNWGRTGKIVAFISGLIVIADLLKPGHLKKVTRAVQVGVAGLAGLAAMIAFGFFVNQIVEQYGQWAWILASVGSLGVAIAMRDHVKQVMAKLTPEALVLIGRWGSLALFLLGFHFDLLAS